MGKKGMMYPRIPDEVKEADAMGVHGSATLQYALDYFMIHATNCIINSEEGIFGMSWWDDDGDRYTVVVTRKEDGKARPRGERNSKAL